MSTLTEQIEACSDGSVIRLAADVEEAVVVPEGKRFTLDLNGHTLSAPAGSTPMLIVGASVRIRNGTIHSTGDSDAVRVGAKGSKVMSRVHLEPSLKVISDEGVGLWLGANAEAETGAEISNVKPGYAAVCGNGLPECWSNSLSVYGGSITSPDTAIYWPQVGDLRILGGRIEAPLGIEIRAGTLTMQGGTVIGTGAPASSNPNGSGTTSAGCGIAIAQHTTKQPISVTITGGSVSGYSAVYESNPQNNPAEDISKVGIALTGGEFSAINNGTVAVYSEDCRGFVSGGTYSTAVDPSLCKDGFDVVLQPDGSYKASVVAWQFPDGGACGGGFLSTRRLIMTRTRFDYQSGGIELPVEGFEPIAVLSASAKGGLTGYYDPDTRKVILYKGAKEASGTLENLSITLIGH